MLQMSKVSEKKTAKVIGLTVATSLKTYFQISNQHLNKNLWLQSQPSSFYMFTPFTSTVSTLWWSSTAFRCRRLLSPKHQTPRWDSMFPVFSDDMLGTPITLRNEIHTGRWYKQLSALVKGGENVQNTISSTYQNQMNIWFKYTSLKKTPWNTHWHQKYPGGPVQPLWASQALSSQPRWKWQCSMKVNLTAWLAKIVQTIRTFLQDKNHNIVDMCFCLRIIYIYIL